MRALLVGGSRTLRPAALDLARAGDEVDVLTRAAERAPAGTRARVGDLADPASVAAALGDDAYDVVIACMPQAHPAARRLVAAHATDLLVHVLPGGYAAPGASVHGRFALAPPGPGRTVHVVLGRVRNRDGSTRQHTPAEISDAALIAVWRGESAVLGGLGPWGRGPTG